MLFNSLTFLIIFLPVTILLYYTLGQTHKVVKNLILLVFSLVFYAWGEPVVVLILLASIGINWLLGLLVDRFREQKKKAKAVLIVTVVINIGILFAYKYLMFFLSSFNLIFSARIPVPKIALPIGISFFTFQAMSYVIDVYRQNGSVQKNPLNVALYISFFPQLIAGPIVRYETVARQIGDRTESFEQFRQGVIRFCIGLAKKVLLANNMAVIADKIFLQGGGSFVGVWVGIIAYALQILFDFSGYSDMAVGLGKMFGFEFLENFDHPYIASSITDFWRRWHISLGTWFRDYLYFPLGGSRSKSKVRICFNLFVVWLLTGLWHGANLTFVLWGLLFFVFLVFEKFTPVGRKLVTIKGLRNIYVLLIVLLGWVLFRSESVTAAGVYMGRMFGVTRLFADETALSLLRQYAVVFPFAILCCLPVKTWLAKIKMFQGARAKIAVRYALDAYALALYFVCFLFIVGGAYNPFIYFNF